MRSTPKTVDRGFLQAALAGLRRRRAEIDEEIAALRRTIEVQEGDARKDQLAASSEREPARKSAIPGRQPRRTGRSAPAPAVRPTSTSSRTGEAGPLAQAFENKAGRYELIRVENANVYYEFTNRHGQVSNSVMAAVTWRILQARAAQA